MENGNGSAPSSRKEIVNRIFNEGGDAALIEMGLEKLIIQRLDNDVSEEDFSLANYICSSDILRSDKPKKTTSVSFSDEEKDKPKENKQTKEDIFDLLSDLRPPRKAHVKTKRKGFREQLASSAENVAQELGGDVEQTKKDILEYVKTLEISTEVAQQPLQDDRDAEIPLDAEILPRKHKRHGSLQRTLTQFKGFRKKTLQEDGVKLLIWNTLNAEELAAEMKRPPNNYFDELIMWTNEGKLWRFPIDNDQGLEEEAATSFTEHVFLEKHLEPWCPERGPLRKFMSMVLIGLSKNPYLSVEEKKEHIMWFKDYFEEKKKLLQELGAMGPTKLEVSNQEQKS